MHGSIELSIVSGRERSSARRPQFFRHTQHTDGERTFNSTRHIVHLRANALNLQSAIAVREEPKDSTSELSQKESGHPGSVLLTWAACCCGVYCLAYDTTDPSRNNRLHCDLQTRITSSELCETTSKKSFEGDRFQLRHAQVGDNLATLHTHHMLGSYTTRKGTRNRSVARTVTGVPGGGLGWCFTAQRAASGHETCTSTINTSVIAYRSLPQDLPAR